MTKVVPINSDKDNEAFEMTESALQPPLERRTVYILGT